MCGFNDLLYSTGAKNAASLLPSLSPWEGEERRREGGGRESEKEDSYLIYTRLFKSPREFLTESPFVIRAPE